MEEETKGNSNEVTALAEKLFIECADRLVGAGSKVTPEAVAQRCFEAAASFVAVKEGQSAGKKAA